MNTPTALECVLALLLLVTWAAGTIIVFLILPDAGETAGLVLVIGVFAFAVDSIIILDCLDVKSKAVTTL